MSSERSITFEKIDLAVLRTPLAGDNPGGANLDESGDARTRWRTVTDAFREARTIERKAAQGTVGFKPKDSPDEKAVSNEPVPRVSDALPKWKTVAEESLHLLSTVSRDLRVAQYLMMALVRTDGFAGLAAACDCITALVETQWNTLGPLPDPDESDQNPEDVRFQPLSDLAGGDQEGLLEEPLRNVPLLEACQFGSFGLEVLPGGVPTHGAADFPAAKNATTLAFLQARHADVLAAKAAWSKLADAVYAAAESRVSMPRGKVDGVLDSCRAALEELSGGQIAPSAASSPDEAGGSAPAGAAGPAGEAGGGLAGRPSTRDDALRSLEAAAAFFQRQDPHSLLAAQVRYVIKMAKMSQVDYLKELIRDRPALDQLSRYVGLDFGDDGTSEQQ